MLRNMGTDPKLLWRGWMKITLCLREAFFLHWVCRLLDPLHETFYVIRHWSWCVIFEENCESFFPIFSVFSSFLQPEILINLMRNRKTIESEKKESGKKEIYLISFTSVPRRVQVVIYNIFIAVLLK